MIKLFWFLGILLLFLTPSAFCVEKISAESFGDVLIYPSGKRPAQKLLLIVSGDGGWVRAVVGVSETLSKDSFFIVGVDINQYLKSISRRHQKCIDLAQDFIGLGKLVKEKYHLDRGLSPILIGYSSGATLVYAAVAQAPPGAFLATFSFGFCPDMQLDQQLCSRKGLEWSRAPNRKQVVFLPAINLQVPWIVFQGLTDQVCDPAVTENFVKQVPKGQYVPLSRVGHGFANLKNWLPRFRQILSELG